jgi:hypothetical protein
VYLYRNGYGTGGEKEDTPMWFLRNRDSLVHLFREEERKNCNHMIETLELKRIGVVEKDKYT